MTDSCDVAIVGLGAMGAMTALELVRRGKRVIGFDRFRPPHGLGASHGKSRIIREAYFEHPMYVPIVQRAFARWTALERESGRRLLVRSGGLMIGRPDGVLVRGARTSGETHGLPFEVASTELAAARWPMFRLAPGEVGLYEPRAGILLPEQGIATALELAQGMGLDARFGEPVLEWAAGERLRVRTAAREVDAGALVLAAGPWMTSDLCRTTLPLTVARQVMFWYDTGADRAALAPGRMPVFIWEWSPGRYVYGFPDLGDGVKLAVHHEGRPADPDRVDRTVADAEAEGLEDVVRTRAPALLGKGRRDAAVCLYTNTPDQDFVLDRHPGDPRVVIVSACSGHGFKFAPALGELAADLVEGRRLAIDLAPFRLARFGAV